MRHSSDGAETPPEGLLEKELTGAIIGAFYTVYSELGYGFLESVYSRALAIEFEYRGIPFHRERLFDVLYRGQVVGDYRPDFIVDQRVVVEVKSTPQLVEADRCQLLNYLRTTKLEVGLLLHFGPEAQFVRMVASEARSLRSRKSSR